VTHVQGGRVVGTVGKAVGGSIRNTAGRALDSAAPVTRAVTKTPAVQLVTSRASGLVGGTPAGLLVAGARNVVPLGAGDVLPSLTPSQTAPSSQPPALGGNNAAPISSREWNTAAIGGPEEGAVTNGLPPVRLLGSPVVTIERVEAASLALLFRPGIDMFVGSTADFADASSSERAPVSDHGGDTAPREPAPASPAPDHGSLGGAGGAGGSIFLLLLASLAGAFVWAAPRLGRWLRPTPDLASLRYILALERPG
jgi:hypothetical protein